MKKTVFARVAFCMGVSAVVSAIALAGCQKGSEPAASSSSAEYPALPVDAGSPVANGTIKVSVSLNPAVAGNAAPGDTVFIFARAAQGPRMPLAVVRKQVKDLPVTVILDDGLSMSPDMKLSTVPEVVVVARVSRSGLAGAKPGDLEGTSAPVKAGGVAVAIDIAKVVTGN